jgi:hypothetical protein
MPLILKQWDLDWAHETLFYNEIKISFKIINIPFSSSVLAEEKLKGKKVKDKVVPVLN